MAYNETLADRVREHLDNLENIEETPMMGGLTFMWNGKMCVGVLKDDLMCRIDPQMHDMAVEQTGVRTLDFTKRRTSGFILVDETALKSDKELTYWIGLALDYNGKAKASKKKTKG